MSRPMRISRRTRKHCVAALAALLLAGGALPGRAQTARRAPRFLQVAPGDSDKTLAALRDELKRSVDRLVIPGLERPYYVEYRLLDLDVRAVTASFGGLISSTTSRSRFMSVDVRVGDYLLDSSNFVAGDAFRGFIGSTGQVGIDRDYTSLRQDLWLATDQAYKEALDSLARKHGFLQSLAKPPNIPDFSREQPVVMVTPREEPDWASRNWDEEAKTVSAALRAYPEIYSNRVSYYLVYATSYLINSEGTMIRVGRSFGAVEANAETQAADGMPLHDFYTAYVNSPAEIPSADTVRQGLDRMGKELAALRGAAPAQDYGGPVLVEAPAAGSLLAQMLAPSISGARPPLSTLPVFNQILDRMGGRSEWSGRLATRVLPTQVTLVDDPTQKKFEGQPLIGSYDVDDEGVRAQRVTIVENGMLRDLLMSRRPGPEFERSNGHGRSVFLSDAHPAMSNLFFTTSAGENPSELRKKFLADCKADGRTWCLLVRRMDNPVVGIQHRADLSEMIASLAGGVSSGERLPLLVYKVNVADGSEELIRGSRLNGLDLRALRGVEGIGNDFAVFSFEQNQSTGFGGTALAAFGSAQNGLPTSVVAPSLLFADVDVAGVRGTARRPPLLPPPPMQ